MKYLKETTDWSNVEYRVPNHTYIFDQDRCVGYIVNGEVKMFDQPLKRFARKGRQFKDVTKEFI